MLKNTILTVLALLTFFSRTSFASIENWSLDHSTITYTIHHTLKTATGTSTQAKGKGKCEKGNCEFLIAVPVKTFESGDSNRDLHMLEVTRGGTNPMVVVQTALNESSLTRSPKINLNFEVQFAGKKVSYKNVPFEILKKNAHSVQTKGVITIKLNEFEITPPSLLAMPIKNEVPIEIDASWKIDTK